MLFIKYTFPSPNDGENYKFTSTELSNLLESIYNKGWNDARDIYDKSKQVTTTTNFDKN